MPGDLIFDPNAVAQADTLVIAVPGALASVAIFDPVVAWVPEGFVRVAYRFPGLDGRAVSPALDLDAAAQEIIEFIALHPGKQVHLLGYSTGGAVVLNVAAGLKTPINVALMSPAVARGGGVRTGLKGARDVIGAAWRARSLKPRAIWLEYYKTLLFGRRVTRDGALNAHAQAVIQARLPKIVMPEGGLPQAHTAHLRRWKVPAREELAQARIRVFVGLADSVFSTAQSREMATQIGADVVGYAGQGHLLFATQPEVFDDVLAFFQGHGPRSDVAEKIGGW